MNGYSSAGRRDSPSIRNDSTSSTPNGLSVSASMLLDPKRMKQQMTNGISSASSSDFSRFQDRRGSEPPRSPPFLSDFDFSSHRSKDDAHAYVEGRGKTLASSNAIAPTQHSNFNAKQLLDPKGFKQKPTVEREDDGSLPDHVKYGPSNGVRHPDVEEAEGQGMGGMIERFHGISPRGERPQKRQKMDHDQENTATFTGGTQKGEIGEYLEQKRKEGQSETPSGPNTVVDLTGGEPSCNVMAT